MMDSKEILECQKIWLDKLQEQSGKPILIKAIEGKLPRELFGTNAEMLYRWSYYKDVWGLIRSPIFTRGILPNEVVFDPDTPIWEDIKIGFDKIVITCIRLNIPYMLAYSGGKGCHLHIFFNTAVNIPEDIFNKAKENKYDLYKAFRQYVFEYIVKESGISIELLKIDKPKINWQIFTMGSQIRDFGTMRNGGFCKTFITEIPTIRPTVPLTLVFPEKVELWKIPEEHIIKVIHKIKVGLAQQTKYNKTEMPPIKGLKIEEIPCISNIMNGLDNGRYYGAGAIALAGKSLKYPWEQVEPLVETFLNRCRGLSQSDITLRIDNSHQLYLSDHEFSCKWIKETLKCINPSECIITISRKEQKEKEEAIDFVSIAEGVLGSYNFITIAETDEIHYYNSGTFHPLGEIKIKTEVQGMVNNINTHIVNEVINTIKRKTYTSISKLNKNPNYIPLENGILDLTTFTIIPYNPSFLLTTRVPVTYDPDAMCPAIDKFFNEIVGSKADVDALHEFFGYCLLRNYVIQKAIMLVGGGGNGKSTLLALLKHFLGDENVTSIALQEIEDNHFAAANLFGKLANIYADLPPKALSATGKIKMLVGGDIITAERKFGGFVSFVNYAKMIFSTNQMPLSYDDTDAFYRRWVIINFPNTFDETKGKGLIDTLITKEEVSGLLNHALRGLKQLLTNGRFSNQKSIDDVREQYVRMSDSIQAFVWDCVEESSRGYVEKKMLYTIYGRYCKTKNIPISTEKRFYTRFPILIRTEEQRITVNEKRVRVFSGIILKMDIENKNDVNNLSGLDVQDVQHSVSLSVLESYNHQIGGNIVPHGATIEENLGHVGQADQHSETILDINSFVYFLQTCWDIYPKPIDQELYLKMIDSMKSSMDVEFENATEDMINESIEKYLKYRGWI